jgi:hypothetical protein
MTAKILPKYSIGMGDRFAHQARAQLEACRKAHDEGANIAPVWNKSNREHVIVGSSPADTRAAADNAIREMRWQKPYFIDADHIDLKTVDRFLEPSDFFTIDVAEQIGRPPQPDDVHAFLRRHPELQQTLEIAGVSRTFDAKSEFVLAVATKYLAAVREAASIYRYISKHKGEGTFVTEVSMDETDSPQTPAELLIILAAIADEQIPIQTIAPKFTGRFNKGVDYVGDVRKFAEEFSDDVATIRFAIDRYHLPPNLKLSVHSGSDKFSIYSPIYETLKRFEAGVHLKTAGTTWLEELIGLAEAGGEALAMAKEIYEQAYSHRDELCAPYASVIDIDAGRLPTPESVRSWSSEHFISALRHDPRSSTYNSSFRQLLHVAFKVASKLGRRYLDQLEKHELVIARNVTANFLERHIRPVFMGG